MVAEHVLGCREEPPGEAGSPLKAPLPYLPPCTGRSIAACRSCPRTPWAQSSGCSRERQGLCSGKEKGRSQSALRERSQPTEQFKVEQVTKKGVSPLLISVTKLDSPQFCPLLRTLAGTWVTSEATHHLCRTTTHPRFGLLEPHSYKWQHFYHHHKQPG